MKPRHEFRTPRRQHGAVLIVALILLLVTTFLGFSSMETSNLETRMATSREIKELVFQTAEAAIETALDDINFISAAYLASLAGSTPAIASYSYDWDDDLTGSAQAVFSTDAATQGYSQRKGASGIATFYYEIRATAARTNTNITALHTQGVFVEGPSLQ
jgi:type IV pilus assembly protein PilX